MKSPNEKYLKYLQTLTPEQRLKKIEKSFVSFADNEYIQLYDWCVFNSKEIVSLNKRIRALEKKVGLKQGRLPTQREMY